MSDEQKKQKKVFDIIEDYIGDVLAARGIAEEIVTALEGESNEAKPAVKYYIEFWGRNGLPKDTRETAYSNYREGDIIHYEHTKWIVKKVSVVEGKSQTIVTFQAQLASD